MKRILQTFGLLDQIRWSYSPNYNLVNYCDADFTADDKLLAHWLCYVTDRQMPFKRIWDVGGYVLSHVVREHARSSRGALAVMTDHIDRVAGQGDTGLAFVCPLEAPNKRLALYGITTGRVRFASRYVPDDVLAVLRTLQMLELVSDRSIARFISIVAPADLPIRRAIRRVAVALDAITYRSSGTSSATRLTEAMDKIPQAMAGEAQQFSEDPMKWVAEKEKRFSPFGKKRLWCALRDYLKSPEFNTHFVASLAASGAGNADRWRRDSSELRCALDELELPGDTWNNNETFRDGLFTPYMANRRRTWDMPQTIRRTYQLLNNDLRGVFYPEQLDVTFDFVPRMCERQICSICLFGGGVKRVCHQQAGLLCSVSLVTCGYEHVCTPAACHLRDDSVRLCCKHFESPLT